MESFTVLCAKLHTIVCKKIATVNTWKNYQVFSTKLYAHEMFRPPEFRTIF